MMEKKSIFTSVNLSRFSIAADFTIPIALYYAMINESNTIAWVLLSIVVLTRLALVIATK